MANLSPITETLSSETRPYTPLNWPEGCPTGRLSDHNITVDITTDNGASALGLDIDCEATIADYGEQDGGAVFIGCKIGKRVISPDNPLWQYIVFPNASELAEAARLYR